MTSVLGLGLLLGCAVLLVPGPPPPALPRRTRPRSGIRLSLRRVRRPAVDAAALAELFAAALESGLTVEAGTRWCADGAEVADPQQWWTQRAPAVARALAVSARLGSPAAMVVRAAADAERERTDAERELRSGLAGVQATAWLLTGLPVIGIVVAALVTGGGSLREPVALLGVIVGLGLTAGGWAWLRTLVGRTRRAAGA